MRRFAHWVCAILSALLLCAAVRAESPADGKERTRVRSIVQETIDQKVAVEVATQAVVVGLEGAQFERASVGDIEIIAPDDAIPPTPVIVHARNVPPEASIAWLVLPPSSGDQFLCLFDRGGNPVNIFWSSTPGTRTFLVMMAEANESGPPKLTYATHVLEYGGSAPPDPPTPPDPPAPPPSPPKELATLLRPIGELGITPADGVELGQFYMELADAVRRDVGILTTLGQVRKAVFRSEEVAFLRTGFVGKYAGFSKIVNDAFEEYVGLADRELSPELKEKVAVFFDGVASAMWPGGD